MDLQRVNLTLDEAPSIEMKVCKGSVTPHLVAQVSPPHQVTQPPDVAMVSREAVEEDPNAEEEEDGSSLSLHSVRSQCRRYSASQEEGVLHPGELQRCPWLP